MSTFNPIGGLYLGAYRCLTSVFSILAKRHLRKRVKRGKEDPNRWVEKLGLPSTPRPQGPLIWLHAVGLGETLALRGVIAAISKHRPEAQFLVTSSTLASAQTFAKNLPERTIHQFLPLDISAYTKRFLDHWKPDLVIWSEQDIWPNFIDQVARRKIPQVLINARMAEHSFGKKQKTKKLFSFVYNCFDVISAQDQKTAENIENLGVSKPIRVDGSLKPFAPPLQVDDIDLAHLRAQTMDRTIHLVASSHAKTETVVIDAFADYIKTEPKALLIIAPRDITRLEAILGTVKHFRVGVRSFGEVPEASTQIYIADTFGDMGLWYSLANTAVIGGTFSDVEGHNPWEAVQIGCSVIHGPRTANFMYDYAVLDENKAALPIATASDLGEIWRGDVWRDTMERAETLRQTQAAKMDHLIESLVDMLPRTDQ